MKMNEIFFNSNETKQYESELLYDKIKEYIGQIAA